MKRWSGSVALLGLVACGGTQTVRQQPMAASLCARFDNHAEAGWPVAQPHTVLIADGTVLTASGTRLDRGYVLFANGRIKYVGPDRPTTPEDTVVIDATGKFVTPGLIDTHSHLGVYASPNSFANDDGNEATSPLTPEVLAQDSIWPQDPGFERAVRGGVTSMQILPGSANLVGGQGYVIKLHRGARVAEQLHFPGAPATLKMACGENPRRVYGENGQMPQTRMGAVALVRQAWLDAKEYREHWDEYTDNLKSWCGGDRQSEPPKGPDRDLAKDTLAGVLRGTVLPQIHCYRADDMLNQIQISHEMGFQIRGFHHAVEAYKIRDVLAAEHISVSTWPDWWGFKMEAFDTTTRAIGLLTEAGVKAVVKSDSPITTQHLNVDAGKALAYARDAGIAVSDNDALRWITANPAWTVGVDGQTGTLETGKMADVVIWSAQPFSTYARAEVVFIDGIEEIGPRAVPGPWSDFEAGLLPPSEVK